MTTNKNLILAGVSAGGSGTSLAWFGPEGTPGPVGAPGTAGVQTVTISGTPTGGTFTLSYNGQVTAPIAYNAAAAAVQSALVALTTVGAGNATVAGASSPYTVTFNAALTPFTLVANGALLTGGSSPSVAVAVTTPGVKTTTTGTAPIPPAFSDAGLISDAGLVAALSETTTELYAYGTTTPVRTLISKSTTSFDVSFLESNVTSLAVYNRLALSALTVNSPLGDVAFSTGAAALPRYAAIFDVVDGVNHLRAYCSSVAATAKKNVTAAPGQSIEYGVTLTAYPDSNNVAIAWSYVLGALATVS
jgi:hypothetical protein